MLIFASALSTIGNATTSPEPLLAQWLASILLGAVNIEQTKYLNWEDLGNLLSQTVRFPAPQRAQLTRLANPETIDAVLRWNHQQLANSPGEDDLRTRFLPLTAWLRGCLQLPSERVLTFIVDTSNIFSVPGPKIRPSARSSSVPPIPVARPSNSRF